MGVCAMDEEIWKGLLERYGQRVSLATEDGRVPVKAFFQPLREREEGSAPSPVGVRPVGKYLYLGPADVPVEEGEELRWDERGFVFRRVRKKPVGERTAYWWGLCEEIDRGEEG